MPYSHSPAWISDLVIYEVAPKVFTSPNGAAGTGNFASLTQKMPYLQSLGINGIWLTGHSWSDPSHFYNIWTQYACIQPDVLDPTLGDEQSFKTMVAAAHDHGIRIILDVIEHGVMEYSPLVKQHPHWFRGKSWGMADYDFDLRDPELDDWWVSVWTYYIVDCGVDGLRIDLGIRRPDLYQRIRDNAAQAGREILFINELNHEGSMFCVAQSELTTLPDRNAYLNVVDMLQRDPITLLSAHSVRPDEVNSQVGYATVWQRDHWQEWLESVLDRANRGELPAWAYSSGQISSHDNGWTGFPHENPYTAQGSRFIFGYGALFSSLVPIFMAGEEFNSPFVAHPTLSPDLFGGANPGKGKWLYGGLVQWDVLDKPHHRAMLHDVQQLLKIRKSESDVLGAVANDQPLNMCAAAFTSDQPIPTPYLRWSRSKIIVVAGTTGTEKAVTAHITIPFEELQWQRAEFVTLTNLWTGDVRTVRQDEVNVLSVTIQPDKTAEGGLALYKIERASS